jgi:NAD(P)-dependent dehydrogenase (short-subunit alcohol dehydrogenase family)
MPAEPHAVRQRWFAAEDGSRAFRPGDFGMELQGKVALVTGAGSGIGAASARLLASAGARIGVLGHTEGELHAVASRIRDSGGEAMPLLADVASAEETSRAVDQLVEAYGRLDIVVANAGINGVWAPIDELAPEEWDRTIAINLRGTFLTLRYAVPRLKRAGGGSVVIVSSINGTRTFTTAGASAYACSKAAQLALGQMAAVELGKHGIRVNIVCPGAIETEISDNTQQRHTEAAEVPAEYPAGEIPLTGERPGRSKDIAELVLFLSSNRSRHISGSPVWIDGAQSLLV